MRHIWSVLCQRAIEDKNSKNFSLIETLSQVSFKGDIPPERPLHLPLSYSIVSLWRRKDDQDCCDYPVRLRVIAPGKIEFDCAQLTAKLSEYDNFKTNFRSEAFQYTENGIYEFEISFRQDEKWIVATQVPLKVTHERPEPEPQESEPAD